MFTEAHTDIPRPQKEGVCEIRKLVLLLTTVFAPLANIVTALARDTLYLSSQVNLLNRKVCRGDLVLDHLLLSRVSCDFSCRDIDKCLVASDWTLVAKEVI